MAPSVKLQDTPSSELKPSVTMCARRRSDASSAAFSCMNFSYDASPAVGRRVVGVVGAVGRQLVVGW